uniref:cytochrome c biogenesis protein n=1 Tax=Klebsormidium subtilissimum TaxID=184584 RepID=UPI00286B3D5E|nr:cytochrome c biogenesis protein [Klebsormidium subtilissimum]WKT08132.1 cytochrome c biogenesis protein [Klebsormidium subtilissimum]
MNYFGFESVLQNGCFISLLLATLLSWWEITFINFFNKTKIYFYKENKFLFKSRIFVWLSSLFVGTILIARWFISQHAPLSTLYESLLWLCWGILTFGLLGNRAEVTHPSVVAAISSSALLINGFANLSLPLSMQIPSYLIPALQSNWLLMHVSVMMFSYSCLFCGSLVSLIFLAVSKKKLKSSFSLQLVNHMFLEKETNYLLLRILDQISVRSITTGFCLLTIGILSGAVWANEAWGSYWSWDPKETWALITWLVFATYLHLRVFQEWEGVRSAILASFGLITLWICYFGLNWLGQGLHTYGLFISNI